MITIIIKNKDKNLEGYLAIDNENSKFGIGKGGLRLSPDVSMQEIERLARVMTKKCRYYNLPYTGAKAGIVFRKGQNKKKLIKAFFTELKNLNLI